MIYEHIRVSSVDPMTTRNHLPAHNVVSLAFYDDRISYLTLIWKWESCLFSNKILMHLPHVWLDTSKKFRRYFSASWPWNTTGACVAYLTRSGKPMMQPLTISLLYSYNF